MRPNTNTREVMVKKQKSQKENQGNMELVNMPICAIAIHGKNR